MEKNKNKFRLALARINQNPIKKDMKLLDRKSIKGNFPSRL
jgi:hypothetical protein